MFSTTTTTTTTLPSPFSPLPAGPTTAPETPAKWSFWSWWETVIAWNQSDGLSFTEAIDAWSGNDDVFPDFSGTYIEDGHNDYLEILRKRDDPAWRAHQSIERRKREMAEAKKANKMAAEKVKKKDKEQVSAEEIASDIKERRRRSGGTESLSFPLSF